MKKTIIFIGICFFLACNQDEKKAEPLAPVTAEEKPVMPELPYSVNRLHWEMGNPAYLKTVLDMYKTWDTKDPNSMANYFADSVAMDMPDARRVMFTGENASAKIKASRSQYGDISNDIISAVSLHDQDRNEDWVFILTYNKWQYKNGGKDSMLFADHWRLKDGKINYLNSLEQSPSKQLLNKLENK